MHKCDQHLIGTFKEIIGVAATVWICEAFSSPVTRFHCMRSVIREIQQGYSFDRIDI